MLLAPMLMMTFAVPTFVCVLAMLIIKEVVVHFTAAYRVELAWIAKNEWWPLLASFALLDGVRWLYHSRMHVGTRMHHTQTVAHDFTRKINSSFTPPRRNQLRLPRSRSKTKYRNYA